MGRSIYCSTCKRQKESGRENESNCKSCKSEAGKKKRAEKRIAMGLAPLGSGRKPHCYDCGAVKENVKSGYCNQCNRRRDNEWRIKTGRTKKHRTGLCPCGNERTGYSKSYCRKCLFEREKEYRKKNPRPPEQTAKYNAHAKRKKLEQLGDRILKQDPINLRRRKIYHDPANLAVKIKHQVRALTRGYIKMGILLKGSCEICETKENIEAHHDDYNKPMEIRWLCRKHHREHHKELNNGDI